MDLKVIISADASALEFARTFGKAFAQFISESDLEAGIAGALGKTIAQTTIEPDILPFEDKEALAKTEEKPIRLEEIRELATAVKKYAGKPDPVKAIMKDLKIVNFLKEENVPQEIRPELKHRLEAALHA